MASRRKKILFITPGAQSFGGNIFLLNFLRWYRQHGSADLITLYGRGGDLSAAFEELGPAYQYYLADDAESLPSMAFAKLANRLELKRSMLRSRIAREPIGLIYSNAVTNGRMLSMFAHLDVPVISHCHELESVIQQAGIDEFNSLKERTTHFIAVSDAVRRNLVEGHDIEESRITVIPGFIPIDERASDVLAESRRSIREQLDLPPDAFLVGASGTLNWRKAPDLFAQLVRAVAACDTSAPIFFVWIGGGRLGDEEVRHLEHDLDKLGVRHRFRFVEHTPRPLDHYAALDVFVLVSREDPFPLVCLEAASLGKPLICFADAGGMPEFVESDAGFVVPYLDLDAMADRIMQLFRDPALRETMGRAAAAKVREGHDIERSAPRVSELIDRSLS